MSNTLTTDEALEFLAGHQPMPNDFDVTTDECDLFSQCLMHFEEKQDARCIPLFIWSVQAGTGLGMYENIRFVLQKHDHALVARHLREGLRSDETSILYRCCGWAKDVDAWELAPQIQQLTTHENEDVREAARAFSELHEQIKSKPIQL